MLRFLRKSNNLDSSSKPSGSSHQLTEFLQLFIPITILIAVGTWALGESRIKAELSTLMADERTYVDLGLGRLDQELAVPIRHLVSLMNEIPVRKVYQATSDSDIGPLEDAFISLMSRNPNYDKVRWIDQHGIERVRVNNRNGQQLLVPKSQLQDKHDRYFFIEAMRVDVGTIYISPLDLNMDNGQIEQPYKPTIRVATPIFDINNSARGILIININARDMLTAFVNSAGPAAKRLMLLNADGYWLKSPEEADEWGFMFHRNATLGARSPALWKEISAHQHGQIRLPDGLWTWNSVSPVPKDNTNLSHNIHWKVVAHLPESIISTLEKQVWPGKIISACIILFLFGFGIARLVQSKAARIQAEQAAAVAHNEAVAAHRLQEAQASFQMLFEANTSGLLVVNSDGHIVMANPAFETMFGYRLSELLHQRVEMLLPDASRSIHSENLAAYMQQPSSRIMGAGRDLYGTRKDGGMFPIEIGLSPYRDNKQLFVLATIVDISERKRAQDEIIRINEALEKRVNERTMELQTAREEAERLSTVKGNFLANMSHEIRTPMNAILGLAYLLEKSKLNPEELDLVKKIRIAGRSLLGIINDILDFSKIESGRLEIEHAPFRLSDVLDNLATLMSAVEHKRDIELIIGTVPEGMEFIRGDALRLEQILINLTTNALKFTEYGTVKVNLAEFSDKDGLKYLRFSVRDTGRGIAQDKQAEIFNAFAQEDCSTSRQYGGTGLGLSITRCLVNMMGGEIGVVSELGKGSEFWFTLPAESIEPEDYAQPAMAFQNVLIADDHPDAREALAAAVRSLGWNPEVVCSGEEAVQRIKERAENNKLPDLILLDWRMPGMDGLEAGQHIKKLLKNLPNPPLIMMATGFDRDMLKTNPNVEVANAILSKPITASTLYNSVSETKRRLYGRRASQSISTFETENGRLRGLQVLVVDDSEINRDMAKRIIESEGAIVHLADDGLSALENLKTQQEPISVVLMDIQMPQMDGYEATYQIRTTLGLTELPVIALTAGAFKNQQAAALAAGMNGFVSKPFDVDELIILLQQYIPNQPLNDLTVSSTDITTPETIMTPIIGLERGLRNWGDKAIYYKYLRKFAEQHGHDGSKIDGLIMSKALADAKSLVHTLKGTAGNLAIMVVWQLAEEIERSLFEEKQTGDLPQMLQFALNDAVQEIEKLTTPSPSNDRTIFCVSDHNTITQLLHQLLKALDKDNPDEAEPSLHALESILSPQAIKPIRDMLDNFDFRSAKTETKTLINELGVNLTEI